uniref:G_PROTEIN_RECEP_F1_2 domain-containing protein n=1 Tax=Meloidogyne floridensis TaxID=298350 RepID=A0A915NHZ1_9BILA
MHVIPDSTMFRSYIIIYGICLFFGGIISYFQFNVILKINTPFDNLLYCNTELYTNLIESYYSIIIISFSIFNYFIIFCKIIWSSSGKKYFKPKNQNSSNNDRPEKDIEAIAKNSFRILRSVLIISLVLIIGWLFSSIERNNILQLIFIISTFLANLSTLKLSINTPGVLYVANIVITFMYIITTGINAIILIICNSEYRNAYKSVFGKLIPKNKVSPNQPLFIKSDKGNNKNNINNVQT